MTVTSKNTRRALARRLALGGMLSALGFILYFFQITLPFLPGFLRFDFSDLPGMIAAFALGPIDGILVCLVKNILHMPISETGYVGELSNFLLGASLVAPAGFIYRSRRTFKGAIIGGIAGIVSMSLFSLVSNYYIIYPLYALVGFSRELVMDAYRAINPHVKNLWQALAIFNLPLTFAKGLAATLIAFVVYKPLSRFMK